MSTRTTLLATLALGLASAACEPPAQEVAGLSAEDMAAIRADTEAFAQAVLDRDWAAATALFSDDAVLMPPNGPAVEGRAAIQAWFESFPTVTEFANPPVKIDGRDDLVFVRGRYELTVMPEGATEPLKDTGKYVDVRRKQPDGTWLVVIDIWNSDLPLPQ